MYVMPVRETFLTGFHCVPDAFTSVYLNKKEKKRAEREAEKKRQTRGRQTKRQTKEANKRGKRDSKKKSGVHASIWSNPERG